jgi:poly(3-hydroxyalkanoate) synthetase
MNIALDYDDTYTLDPVAWSGFIAMMIERNHKVYLVTWRTPEETNADIENIRTKLTDIIFTSRKAKFYFVEKLSIYIHVWIDDNPWAITSTMQGWE